MEFNKKSNALSLLFILLSFTFATSCSSDDNTSDPSDTVTLNMLDEHNGKTRLGVSDVYIDKANNFHGAYSLIANAGSVGGVGVNINPKLDNLVYETAVTVGHAYQVFDKSTLLVFPSGVRAIELGAAYYKFYVVSPIIKDDESIGFVVKYISVYPEKKGLPENNSEVGEVNHAGQTISVEIPKNAEYYLSGGLLEVFDVSTDNGKLQMTLNKTPTEYNGVRGRYEVYFRVGDTYTAVVIRVV